MRMNMLDQFDARIAAAMQLYGESQDAPALEDMSPVEVQKYRLTARNPQQNSDRLYLLQKIRNWVEQFREETLASETSISEADAMDRLERKISKNIVEKDLISAEVLQRVNIWLNEIRYHDYS